MQNGIGEFSTTFRFKVQQEVRLKSLKLPAFVVQRSDCGNGLHSYYIVYYANNERRDEWVFERELEEMNGNGKAHNGNGFA